LNQNENTYTHTANGGRTTATGCWEKKAEQNDKGLETFRKERESNAYHRFFSPAGSLALKVGSCRNDDATRADSSCLKRERIKGSKISKAGLQSYAWHTTISIQMTNKKKER
jgi:hypothetical protein